uniref:CCR4-NOT transcription complex subunit 1-like n=1 Tax=Kalanchoe fedtschenkoi TaxID=63787 RepID=A0A7N0SZB9_KALFE
MASCQIRLLFQADSDFAFRDLCKFVDMGTKESIMVMQHCLDNLNGQNASSKGSSIGITPVDPEFLESLCHSLSLSTSERMIVGLALAESEDPIIRLHGMNCTIAHTEQLCASPINLTEQIQNIIMLLNQSDCLSKHVASIMKMISQEDIVDRNSFLLAPLHSNELYGANFTRVLDFFENGKDDYESILEEMNMESSPSDILMELGYGCTVNTTQCKEIFSLFLPLTEPLVARIISTVAQTYTGLDAHQHAVSALSLAVGKDNLSDLPSMSSWNVDVLVDSIKQLAPGINWTTVIDNLDHDGFYLPNMEALSFLMSIYNRACQEPFPLHTICGFIWKNTEGQISFLKSAVSAPPEVFTFTHSMRKMAYFDAVHDHTLQGRHGNFAWLSLELMEVLCQLAESGHASSVRSMLDFPLKHCPYILLLGMAQINTTYYLLQQEVLSTVFPSLWKTPAANGLILQLWNLNRDIVVRGFLKAYDIHPVSIIKTLDFCMELKNLAPVLEMVPISFGIRLASLATRKDLLDLEKWLSGHLRTDRDYFFEQCIVFLNELQLGEVQNVSPSSSNDVDLLSFYADTKPTFLKVLQAHRSVITSPHLPEEVSKLHGALLVGSKFKNEGPADSSASTLEIEDESNSYYQKLFNGDLTIDALVQTLSRFKESSDEREKAVSNCMISNLFEEYRFFPQYPDTQLRIAAVLFGSVIKHQLVTHLHLGLACRDVLDALRKPADSKMFEFGTTAVEQFVDRLIEWPQYCNHILQISQLRSAHPELILFIEGVLARTSASHVEAHGGIIASSDLNAASSRANMATESSLRQLGQQDTSALQHSHIQQSSIDERPKVSVTLSNHAKLVPSAPGQSTSLLLGDALHSQKPQSVPRVPSVPTSSPAYIRPANGTSSILRPQSSSTGFGSALNIETLVAAAEKRGNLIEVPSSEIQDKIMFTFNNISIANFDSKAKEFAEILKEQHYPWFSQYLVMKRASIEPNYHELYLKFLDKVNLKPLNNEILQATYENCRVLLGSDLIKSSSEERSLLKNLGSWLGKFTIGKNQVLLAREIDPKSLIIEAYEKGLMIAVIPFTSKILEACLNSIAYQPLNPWTAGILGLLSEIYGMPNLKMNLKFDIEVLFKNLGVKDIPPTSLLKDRVRVVEGNPDFSNKEIVTSQPPPVVTESKSTIVSALNQIELPLEMSSPNLSGGHAHMLSKLSTPIPNIGTHVVINPKLAALGLHLHFQRVVTIAMDRAIKESVGNIVQRSVAIATQTSKELVLKDYAMDSDESCIYNAAQLLVANLAGSLAHVTCKEPLRVSISSQLRNSLQSLNITSELLEQAVLLVTNDNLDLGCAIIEQAATNKAIQNIDGEIGRQLSLRRKHRESVASAMFESSIFAQRSVGAIPASKRPKSASVSISQQRVYEDFVRLPWQNQSGTVGTQVDTSAVRGTVSNAYGLALGQLNQGAVSSSFEIGGSQPINFAPVESDSSSFHLPNCSAAHGGASHGFSHSPDIDNAAVYSATAPDLQEAEPSITTKDFGSSTPPLPSVSVPECSGSSIAEPLLHTRDALDKYQLLLLKLEMFVKNDAKEADIQGVIAEVPEILLRCISRDEAALAMAQKAFKGMYENVLSSLSISSHLAILAAICDVCKLVVKELTSWVIYSDEDRKFNKDIIVGLMRLELLNLAEYNLHMAKLIDGGRNKPATEFSIALLQALLFEESGVTSELPNLVDALAKIATRPGSPVSLQKLMEIVKNPSSISAAKENKAKQSKDDKTTVASREEYPNAEPSEQEPEGFHEQVSALFVEWWRICELPGTNDMACSRYVLQLQQNGLLEGDDVSDRFFRILIEISVSHCVSSEGIMSGSALSTQKSQPISFFAIDIYAKLVSSVLQYCVAEQGSSKLFLLSKVLAVTVRCIHEDANEKKTLFNPRPYFRLFINWLRDLCPPDLVLNGENFQTLTAFANAFHGLQPLKIPSFSFAWLDLVSHRTFMPKLLTGSLQNGWPYMQRFLVELFQYLEPFLRNAAHGEPIQLVYKGTLRVLLVLLHDFPEFLCDYHFTFCDVIPPSCIQMRNIILSAFPRNMRLPDPSTPNLKIDLLPEISQSPRVLSEVDAALKSKQMKSEIDEYAKAWPKGTSFLTDLKQRLLLPPNEADRAGTKYNVPLMNSLVLYVGMQATQQLQAKSPHTQAMSVYLAGAALDIFQNLIVNLDTEGRYIFLNAIANQLRYPNNHTHYFSFILLHLFTDSHQEIIQEQITRVLLERLIANRPHPWGLLITILELIKNPRYNFWNQSFIRCAPEIEKLFGSVSRSIGDPKPGNGENMVSA